MGLLRIDPGGCERICDLPDDLILEILLLVPTKDALATQILSKRWRHVPKMLPNLLFKDDQGSESLGLFIDKSLQLHKAPRLLELTVELSPPCHVDITKWVEKAINHGVRKLDFKLAQPTTFPSSLYTCKTLTCLSLSENILVHVPFSASLPSLLYLDLENVMYKDDDSLARLLSSSPVLQQLMVDRLNDDNLTNFIVKVPTLKVFSYTTCPPEELENKNHIGSLLVVDCPALTNLLLFDYQGSYWSLNMSCLNEVGISYFPNHNATLMPCLSSARRLYFGLSGSMIACCYTVKFSRLVDLFFAPYSGFNWLEPLFFFLQNSPTLKTLTIYSPDNPKCFGIWNQPNTIPACLLSHLEIVRWKGYGGRKCEKKLMRYIMDNSKCLKKVEISLIATGNLEMCQKELETMPRILTSSLLLYSAPQADWGFCFQPL